MVFLRHSWGGGSKPMRKTRYVLALLTLFLALGITAAPRERDERPSFAKRFVRAMKFVLQPLGDILSPPHP
jgi:hypothetical protein